MSKKRSQRQRNLAAEEARREAHARLVVQRHRDPRFAQRERVDDETVRVTLPSGEISDEVQAAAEMLRLQFRAKFGRDPGPDDPLFFDPDADEPRPMSQEYLDAGMREFAEHLASEGVDPTPVLVMRDLGYVVTEGTQHLFSAAEIEAFGEARAYYESFDDPMSAPPLTDPVGVPGDVDTGASSVRPGDTEHILDMLLSSVVEVVQTRKARAGRKIFGMLEDFEADGGDSGPAFAAFASMAMGFSSGVEQRGLHAGYGRADALAWIRENLGGLAANAAARAADAAAKIETGAPAERKVLDDLFDDLGDLVLPAFVWLLAGAVATAGDGNVEWLSQVASTDSD